MNTDSIKELVGRLKEESPRLSDGSNKIAQPYQWAIDALEAMAGEVERLKTDYGLLCDTLRDDRAAHAAERDRLKAALQPFSDAYERLVRMQESMGFSDNASFGLGIKVSAIKAARKALEEK